MKTFIKENRTIWILFFMSLLVMAFSMSHWPGKDWISLVITFPIVFYYGRQFHIRTYKGLKNLTFTMDTLVSISVLVAFFYSAGITVTQSFQAHNSLHTYFDAAAMITAFLLLGRKLEEKARRSAGENLRSLLELAPSNALVRIDNEWVQKPVAELALNDLVLVRVGDKFPIDGIVSSGASEVDLSLLNGESLPISVRPGDKVYAGSLNTLATLEVRVTALAGQRQLDQINALVTQAQSAKPPIQRLADKISAVFVPAVLLIACLTFVSYWYLYGDPRAGFIPTVTVLIIACPCALGLATPTAILVGTSRAAKAGILIKEPKTLELAKSIDTVVLDKTGTLTTGVMRVQNYHALSAQEGGANLSNKQFMQLIAKAESVSEHPLSRAIVEANKSLQAGKEESTQTISESTNHNGSDTLPAHKIYPGMGLQAVVAGQCITIGKLDWFKKSGLEIPEHLTKTKRAWEQEGLTTVIAYASSATDMTDTMTDLARPSSEESANSSAEISAQNDPSINPQLPSEAQGETSYRYTFKISGMTCSSCVTRVEKAFAKAGLSECKVNLAIDSAQAESSEEIDLETVYRTLDNSGYPVSLSNKEIIENKAINATNSPYDSAHDNSSVSILNAPENNISSVDASTELHLSEGIFLGIVGIADQLREDASSGIKQLKQLGLDTVILSGDSFKVVNNIAQKLNISRFKAEVLPKDKLREVQLMQDNGHYVAMVGDGINDAAALAQAGAKGIGIAMGSGSDLAIGNADIIILRPGIAILSDAINISRETLKIIRQNLFWAFGYNLIAIPLATAGLANPMAASALMALSSTLVVGNSLRLNKAISMQEKQI